MTDTLTRPTRGPRNDHGSWIGRLARSLAYAAALAPVGVLTIGDALLGDPREAGQRWQRLAHHRPATHSRAGSPASRVRVFGYGLISALMGLAGLFVMFLVVLCVVRGPFWGFVEHGPVEPGTWGGPTRAGAWAVHGLIAVPCVVVFLFALRGIAALQSLLVRPLYGAVSRWWVLPATIVLAGGAVAFFWAWLQQV
ncbi:hypothetical protein [Kribbella sp. NPDC004875]|uniref:hypothetical protein n=1 Tax=Kribbella sp. NPDC004875 TaxID=3364107 RepID=UPI0036C83A70